MKKVFFIFLLTVLFFPLFAQSADIVTEMLNTKQVSWSQAAYFAATWIYPEESVKSESDAFSLMVQDGYIGKSVNSEKPINLQSFAGLCTKIWNIKGGLFYGFTKADRYAFRELKAKGILQQSDDPLQKMSGRDALNIINSCTELYSASGENK